MMPSTTIENAADEQDAAQDGAENVSLEERRAELEAYARDVRERSQRLGEQHLARVDGLLAVIKDLEKQTEKARTAIEQSTNQITEDLSKEIDSLADPEAGPVTGPRKIAISAPSPMERRKHVATSVSREPSPGARLLAVQMRMAGADREDVAERLRLDFGIEDPDAIVAGT